MTSPPLLLPSDLLVTKPHGPIPTGRQRARESKLAHASQSPRHRAGKRGLESVSEWWAKKRYPALLFSRVQWIHPPALACRTSELPGDAKGWTSHFLLLRGPPTGPGCLRASQLEQPEAQRWSDVRFCLSTAGIAVLAEAHDAWKPKETLVEPLSPACVTQVPSPPDWGQPALWVSSSSGGSGEAAVGTPQVSWGGGGWGSGGRGEHLTVHTSNSWEAKQLSGWLGRAAFPLKWLLIWQVSLRRGFICTSSLPDSLWFWLNFENSNNCMEALYIPNHRS